MCDLLRREFIGGTVAAIASMTTSSLVAGDNSAKGRKWLIGHHFWNWDRAWDKGEFLDKRLDLTKQTGYDGFEGKPHQIGQPAEVVKAKDVPLVTKWDICGNGLLSAKVKGV